MRKGGYTILAPPFLKVDLALSFAEPFLTSYERWICFKPVQKLLSFFFTFSPC